MNRMLTIGVVGVLCGLTLMACNTGEDNYTLYKSSVRRDLDRGEVARFNVKGLGILDYNLGNCEKAAELFQAQPDNTVEYWCELDNDFSVR